MAEKILLRHEDVPGLVNLSGYEGDGGYRAARKVLTQQSAADVIALVKASNLRGRGGAGFPAGVKWGFLPKNSPLPRYLCVNADESEPGTFKDRQIIENNPHMLLEGSLIAAYAIECHKAYIYIRGEFARGAKLLEKAISEAYAAGHFGRNIYGTGYDLDISVHRGAGAYICGEETGLIASLEGRRAYPRVKPPFPATYGVFGAPTIVNNVETLSCLPAIIERGPEWFRSIGPDNCPGPKLYGVSGHVNRPGVFELPMGTSLREIIEVHAGGVWKGKRLKAVIPGGTSVPIFKADEIDVPMDFDSVAKAGSMLGSAGIIVMDEDTCMVRTLQTLAKFYHHESCGQCTPCREGTGWLHRLTTHLEEGGAAPGDVDLLARVADNMLGNTVCLLADAAAVPVTSFVKKFRDEFDEHLRLGGCPQHLSSGAHNAAMAASA
jgi:NADH-quinone oxidoreductase subunit F